MKSDKTQRGPKGFILLEPGNIMQILPEDNKSWLTLFYSLPEELVSKRPAYMNLPRCPFDVIRSNDYSELLNTDVFLELVWDCYAWSAWQYFEVPSKDGDYREIPGSFNSYSGDFPLWRLSYTIIPYIREKFEHIGLSFQSLFNMPRGMEVPFLTYQQFSNLIGSVVPMIVKEQNWQPMIDTIWATRDETDYDFRSSLVKRNSCENGRIPEPVSARCCPWISSWRMLRIPLLPKALLLRKRSLKARPSKHLSRPFQNVTGRYFS